MLYQLSYLGVLQRGPKPIDRAVYRVTVTVLLNSVILQAIKLAIGSDAH